LHEDVTVEELAINSGNSSGPADTSLLLEEFLDASASPQQSDEFVERFVALIEQDPNIIGDLLNHDSIDQEHVIEMMMMAVYEGNDAVTDILREAALNLSYSDNDFDIEKGMEVLASMAQNADPIARRRLLDVSSTDQSVNAQLSILEGLSPVLVPPSERDEIKAILLENVQSSPYPDVRIAAIMQLEGWDHSNETFISAAVNMIGDTEPEVRVAGIEAFGLRGVPEVQQSMLFDIANNQQENMQVRVAAAEVLHDAALSDYEYEVVAALLKQ